MFKNVSGQKIVVFVFDVTTGLPKTGDGPQLTLYVNKDWGGLNVLGDTSATELSSTHDPGSYQFDLTQAETNADVLRFSGVSSTSSNIVIVAQTIYTVPANFTAQVIDSSGRVDISKLAGTTLTARDIGQSVLLTTGDMQTIADTMLNRNLAGGANGTQTVAEALYFLRCNWSISSGVLSVMKPDGSTAWTKNVATNSAAIPITGVS